VQETWLGVVKGLDQFQGRSSLKTWIFSILVNIARSRGVRESRCRAFSCFGEGEGYRPSVDADRFLGADHDRWPGHWAVPPSRWTAPEEGVLTAELREAIRQAIDELPKAQRTVISLRDVEGWAADEVCEALGVSEGNQRVLLHRARSKVRAALERELAPAGAAV